MSGKREKKVRREIKRVAKKTAYLQQQELHDFLMRKSLWYRIKLAIRVVLKLKPKNK